MPRSSPRSPDILEQERLANLVVSQGLSVRNLRTPPGGRATEPPRPQPPQVPPRLTWPIYQKSLSRQLGMRIQLRTGAKKDKGRLIVHYASLDQFDDLLDRLGAESRVGGWVFYVERG